VTFPLFSLHFSHFRCSNFCSSCRSLLIGALRYGIFEHLRSFVSASYSRILVFSVFPSAGALDYAYSEVTAVDWRYESSAKNAEEEEVQRLSLSVSLSLSLSYVSLCLSRSVSRCVFPRRSLSLSLSRARSLLLLVPLLYVCSFQRTFSDLPPGILSGHFRGTSSLLRCHPNRYHCEPRTLFSETLHALHRGF
jgi:hypothetical protein